MIVSYTGRRGAGKTLSMIKDAYRLYQNGWEICSNIELRFPYTHMTEKEMLLIDDKSELNNCVLVIDEIQTMIDSRRSMGSKNVDFSYFIQQIRKRNVLILCTTQYIGTVDLRLRQHIDVLARPRFYKNFNLCEVTYIDMTVVDENDLWGGHLPGFEIVFDARSVFPLYDTFGIVKKIEKEKKTKKKVTS